MTIRKVIVALMIVALSGVVVWRIAQDARARDVLQQKLDRANVRADSLRTDFAAQIALFEVKKVRSARQAHEAEVVTDGTLTSPPAPIPTDGIPFPGADTIFCTPLAAFRKWQDSLRTSIGNERNRHAYNISIRDELIAQAQVKYHDLDSLYVETAGIAADAIRRDRPWSLTASLIVDATGTPRVGIGLSRRLVRIPFLP